MKKNEKKYKYAWILAAVFFIVALVSFTPFIFLIFNVPGDTVLNVLIGSLFWGTILGIPFGITGFFTGLFQKKRKTISVVLLIVSIIVYMYLILGLNGLGSSFGGMIG
ncbi:hypothetical protein KY366_06870 [Candidatus Woesearchaeota archaeon]|nr:hypothetical protein [Candidatus Woesearchaeota archaeon]